LGAVSTLVGLFKGNLMVKESIIAQLREYLMSEIFDQAELQLGENDPIISNGLIDSFSLVDFALFIEDAFQVKIDDTDINANTFDTLNELAELIRLRRKS
jgi:acyl carrier protein